MGVGWHDTCIDLLGVSTRHNAFALSLTSFAESLCVLFLRISSCSHSLRRAFRGWSYRRSRMGVNRWMHLSTHHWRYSLEVSHLRGGLGSDYYRSGFSCLTNSDWGSLVISLFANSDCLVSHLRSLRSFTLVIHAQHLLPLRREKCCSDSEPIWGISYSR